MKNGFFGPGKGAHFKRTKEYHPIEERSQKRCNINAKLAKCHDAQESLGLHPEVCWLWMVYSPLTDRIELLSPMALDALEGNGILFYVQELCNTKRLSDFSE